MENPLELMYGWQALLCAVACTGVAQLVKTILDLTMGAEKRKANRWVTRLVLPLIPIVAGMLYGLLVPFRPEALIAFVAEHADDAWGYLGYSVWGGACGQFSAYLYTHVKKLIVTKAGEPKKS